MPPPPSPPTSILTSLRAAGSSLHAPQDSRQRGTQCSARGCGVWGGKGDDASSQRPASNTCNSGVCCKGMKRRGTPCSALLCEVPVGRWCKTCGESLCKSSRTHLARSRTSRALVQRGSRPAGPRTPRPRPWRCEGPKGSGLHARAFVHAVVGPRKLVRVAWRLKWCVRTHIPSQHVAHAWTKRRATHPAWTAAQTTACPQRRPGPGAPPTRGLRRTPPAPRLSHRHPHHPPASRYQNLHQPLLPAP